MSDSIKILFAGDLALLGAAESLPDRPYSIKIDPCILKVIKQHDLFIVNLETPLTESSGKILKTGPHLKGHPQSINLLKDLGVDVVCLSNNHIRDFDDRGVMDTIDICSRNGIKCIGAGRNREEAMNPLYIMLNGKRIALLNFSESEFNEATDHQAGSNPDEPINIWYSFQKAKSESDLQIAIMHGGKEMHPLPTPYQVKLFRFMVDLGFNAVIGHHSHVIGGYELYHEKPIVYSLGNFIFDDECTSPSWHQGGLVGLEFNYVNMADVRFFIVNHEKGNLSFEGSENLYDELNEIIFFRKTSYSDVEKAWDHTVDLSSTKTAKKLLNLNLFRRLLFKLGWNLISEKDAKFLLSLGNNLRSHTHRFFVLNSIQCFIKKRLTK